MGRTRGRHRRLVPLELRRAALNRRWRCAESTIGDDYADSLPPRVRSAIHKVCAYSIAMAIISTYHSDIYISINISIRMMNLITISPLRIIYYNFSCVFGPPEPGSIR